MNGLMLKIIWEKILTYLGICTEKKKKEMQINYWDFMAQNRIFYDNDIFSWNMFGMNYTCRAMENESALTSAP